MFGWIKESAVYEAGLIGSSSWDEESSSYKVQLPAEVLQEAARVMDKGYLFYVHGTIEAEGTESEFYLRANKMEANRILFAEGSSLTEGLLTISHFDLTHVETEVADLMHDVTDLQTALYSDDARFSFEDGLKDTTVNLLNPDTLVKGYILVKNVPTEKTNYFYSDYIYVGNNTIYYRDHGASIGYLMSCYDKDKNYLGAIDYSTDGYERIAVATPTGYYKLTPKQGTVYIRVNGRYTSSLMLCPYFYPTEYIEYGKTFTKTPTDTLKVAMFGDSITFGTNGNDHSNPAVKNLPYWVQRITGFNVDNQGVGSMGWVSTQYLDQIAYDKVSTTDLTGYDVITLCYGVNDTGAVLGGYESTDETTIMGQINKIIKYIGAQNPKAKIILIAPWNGASSGATFPSWGYGRTVYYSASGDASRTKTRGDLGAEEKKLCNLYGLGYISQEDSPLNGFGLGAADGTTPGPYIGADLVHPSLDGYKAIGEWLAAKIKSIIDYK